MSLPSPGSQTNVSLPLPNNPTSVPPLPSIESLPLPPTSVSAPEPPARVSFPLPPSSVTAPAPPTRLSSPFPPSIVVGIVSVKRPLLSSMRTTSSPFPPLTEIFAISARANLKSAEPSSPTSTCRIAGFPFCSRSASRSPALVPSIASSPCASCGSSSAASFRSCDCSREWWAGGGAVSGRGRCRAADGGDRSHRRDGQQRRPHYTRVVESNEVPHGVLSGVE